MRLRHRQEDFGAVCPWCGINLRSDSSAVLHIMSSMHIDTHITDLIEGAEDMLRRCAGE